MPLGRKKVSWLTGIGFLLVTLLLRLPFISQTLFELDSVNLAVATFRFSLVEVTPHMPGYILPILLARFILLFTNDHNAAFTAMSVAGSVISVLAMWRAGVHLRGERLGVIAGCLWMTTPMFWFYSEVATVYIYEALFTSLIIYLGIRILRSPDDKRFPLLLIIVYAISAAARQTSVLFFLPAIVYLFIVTKQPLRTVLLSLGLWIVITVMWSVVLLNESGGIAAYLSALDNEYIYRTQSVLFGNKLGEHLSVIGKMLFYLVVGSMPMIFILCIAVVVSPQHTLRFVRDVFGKRSFRFTALTALPAFLFYTVFYFMKAGYLLNILPAVILSAAVLLDQSMIRLTEKQRQHPQNRRVLTGKMITRNVSLFMIVSCSLNILWFILPLPGKERTLYDDLFTRESIYGPERSKHSIGSSGFTTLLNKAFAYTSYQKISAQDNTTSTVRAIIDSFGAANVVTLDTWWHRFSYYYYPDMLAYHISSTGADTLDHPYKHYKYHIERTVQDTEYIAPDKTVLILIRDDHPDLPDIRRHVSLVPLTRNRYLGIYRIMDTSFTLTWKDKTFVQRSVR
jgi:hypothetical protein